MFKFRWRSRTDSPDGGSDIATLVRRAFAEVCTVQVLLVIIIRPHRSTTYVYAVYCGVAWSVGLSVGLSVCLSVTLVSPAKTVEPIEMSFELRTQVG